MSQMNEVLYSGGDPDRGRLQYSFEASNALQLGSDVSPRVPLGMHGSFDDVFGSHDPTGGATTAYPLWHEPPSPGDGGAVSHYFIEHSVDADMMTDTAIDSSITPSNMIELSAPNDQERMMADDYKYEDERTPESVASTDSSATLGYDEPSTPATHHHATQPSPIQSPHATAPNLNQGSHHAAGNPTQKRTTAKRKVSAATGGSVASPSAGGVATTQGASKKRARTSDASEQMANESAGWSPAAAGRSSGAQEESGPPPAKRQVSKAPRKVPAPQERAASAASSYGAGASSSALKNNPNNALTTTATSPSSSQTPATPTSGLASKCPRFPHPSSSAKSHTSNNTSNTTSTSLPRPLDTRLDQSAANNGGTSASATSAVGSPAGDAHVRSPTFQAPPTLPNYLRVASSPHAVDVESTQAYGVAHHSAAVVGEEQQQQSGTQSSYSSGTLPAVSPLNPVQASSLVGGRANAPGSGSPMASSASQQPKYQTHSATSTYGSAPSTPSTSSNSTAYPAGASSTTMNGDRQARQHSVGSPQGTTPPGATSSAGAEPEQQQQQTTDSRHPTHARRPSFSQAKTPQGMWQGEPYMQAQQMHSPQLGLQTTQQQQQSQQLHHHHQVGSLSGASSAQQQQQQQQHQQLQQLQQHSQPSGHQTSQTPQTAPSGLQASEMAGASGWSAQNMTPASGYYMQRLATLNHAVAAPPNIGQGAPHGQPPLGANRQPPASMPPTNAASNALQNSMSTIPNLPPHATPQYPTQAAQRQPPALIDRGQGLPFVIRDPVIIGLENYSSNNAELFRSSIAMPTGNNEFLNALDKYRRNLLEMVRICGNILGPLDPQTLSPLTSTGSKNSPHTLHQSGPQMKTDLAKSTDPNQLSFAAPTQRGLAASSPQVQPMQPLQHHPQMQAQQQAQRNKTGPLPSFSTGTAANAAMQQQQQQQHQNPQIMGQMAQAAGLPQAQQQQQQQMRYGYRPQEFSPLPVAQQAPSNGAPSYYEALLQRNQPLQLPSHQAPQQMQLGHAMEVDPSHQWNGGHHMVAERSTEQQQQRMMSSMEHMHSMQQQQQQQHLQQQQQQQQQQQMRSAPNAQSRAGQFYAPPPYSMENPHQYAHNLPHWSPSGHHPTDIAGQPHGAPQRG